MNIIEVRKGGGGWKTLDGYSGDIQEIVKKAEAVLSRTKSVVLINLDENGIPNARAMTSGITEGLKHMWLSTNTSSRHVTELSQNPLTTIYCYDGSTYESVMLVGHASEEPDEEWRKKLWKKWYDNAFKGGLKDPDYLILRFDIDWVRYSGAGLNITFGFAEQSGQIRQG